MTSHQEKGEKNATPDSRHPSDSNEAEGSAETSKAQLMREKLTVVGHYIMLGLAPVISVIALAVGVLAVTGNHSGEEQLSKSMAKLDILSANLAASKAELERLKLALAQGKNAQEEERKKQDEQLAKIIQNITPLQVKLKISPTLEEQLRQAASAATVATALPVVASSVPAASAVTTTAEKKLSPKVKVMKDAIDKYNKSN